jgi:CBS domain containing-hemolysin-like protein
LPPETEFSGAATAGRLAAVLGLVLLNGFFVASEFALVGARSSKLAEMAAGGDRLAKYAQRAVAELDRYLSATQLGITLASLALGWIGEPAVAVFVDALMKQFGVVPTAPAAHTVAGVVTAFTVITFLHVVYGELAPKSVALVMPERLSGYVALPLMGFTKLMTPFIKVLNGTANASLRLIGIQPVSELKEVHSPEELRLIVMQSRAHGALGESDSAMLAGVFEFHEKRAADIMRPRTDVVGVPAAATEAEIRATLSRERYSRYPVVDGSLDNVLGLFVAKDLWLHEGPEPFSLAKATREMPFVPASRPAQRVLDDLRKSRAGMAVVLDEFGGTAGIITLEDLVEEVVGDIADEHDAVARRAIESGGTLELEGALSLVDVRSDHHLAIPHGDWVTLGGYVFARLGRLPKVGDRVSYPGGELEVIAVDGKRVAGVRVLRAPAAGAK